MEVGLSAEAKTPANHAHARDWQCVSNGLDQQTTTGVGVQGNVADRKTARKFETPDADHVSLRTE